MEAHLSCPRGHRWPLADADARADAASPVVCPVCGPVAEAPPDPPTLRLRPSPGNPTHHTPRVAGYQILGEVGRGGMGVVYQALQLKLNRVVALKMILDDCHSRPQEYARFIHEAEVIAGLNHPNIVQIYEIGEADGRPFFSLEFIEGGSLAQYLRAGGPLHPRQAALLIRDLARAVDVAHQQGVVHRDLKPANILLSGEHKSARPASPTPLVPKITDFGLAKRRDSGLKTTAGFILGTPCYMAPEQAAGKVDQVGPASDVYALGAILYELLAGRPPFEGDTPLITLQQVLSQDPVAPTQVRPQAPTDLEKICLKCLQKEPRRRYTAGADLADDLGRFLDGRPVLAQPPKAAERLVKWMRRRPTAAAFLGVSLLAAVLMAVGGVWHTLQLQDALAATDLARIDAQEQRDASLQAKNLAEERDRRLREYVYAVQVRQAHQLWAHADLGQMRELLEPYAAHADIDPREFTWRYLWRLSHGERRTLEGHESDVYFVAYSPDGATLATTGREGTVRLWDAATGAQRLLLRGHDGDANWAAFSPDGGRLASVGDDGRIILWDVRTGRELRRLHDRGDEVLGVAWDPTGRLLATGGKDGKVHLWDVEAGRESPSLEGHTNQLESLAFAPDGRLASAAKDGTVRVWDLKLGGAPRILAVGPCPVQSIAWSRDGRRLAAACGDGTVRLWDAETWQPHPPFLAHLGEVHGVAFSPDGKTLATGGNDHLVRLWDVETGSPRNILKGHADRVWSVAFSPDGKTLASAGRDRVVKFWDPELRQEWQTVPMGGAVVVAADPHGAALAEGLPDGSIRLRPTCGDAPPVVLPRQIDSASAALAYSADGRRLGAQTGDGAIVVWDVDGRRPRVLRGPTRITFGPIALSADGGVLACQAADGSLQLWDTATGTTLPSPVQVGAEYTCVAFSPAGDMLAVALNDEYQVVLYDVRTGQNRGTLRGHRAPVRCMAFSADGKTLATGSEDQTAKLWDVESGREKVGSLLGHADAVLAVAVHPDGKTIATGGADHVVKLWDAVTGQELATLPAHSGRVRTLVFTPDGNALLSVGDGPGPDEARLWSAALSPCGRGRSRE